MNSATQGIDTFAIAGALTLGNGVASLLGTDLGSGALSLGTVFTLATYASQTGTFQGLAQGADITVGNYLYQVNYGATALTLTAVSAVPEPSVWTLLGAGAFGLFAVVRRRRTA